MSRVGLSVLVPTKNEQSNIAECIESVRWADEIFVLDSYSTDDTTRIAEASGAHVIRRAFDNYAANKNWALRNIRFRNEYLLILDADMRVSEELRKEIVNELSGPEAADGYYIPMRNYFNDVWLRRGGWYPNYHLRLFRHRLASFEHRIVHEHVIVNGRVKYLRGDVYHFDRKGIEHFLERHNFYSTLEAIEARKTILGDEGARSLPADPWSQGPLRRRFLKRMAYRYVPARPLVKFLWMYFLKLGFLDGRIGFRYCLLHAFYEYQINLKLEELRDKKSPLYIRYRDHIERDDGVPATNNKAQE
jgi:glycosyltransferase involved in cell wall biosynthesis